MEITFLGTSGSVAYNNGNSRRKYGTNTSCIAVAAGSETLIFDAGTGICGFKDNAGNGKINLFLSHYHADHISGLLFFSDIFNPSKKIDIYADRDVINNFLSPPLCPVTGLEVFGAQVSFHETEPGKPLLLSDVTVLPFEVSHPGTALGFRVTHGGKSLCFCPDIELADHQNDDNLHRFTDGADLLIIDAFFDDGKVIKNWGHSSWRECAELAKKTGVVKLALFHYDFKMSDSDIDEMVQSAQKIFPETFGAADFMRLEV
jgi:ribonuclease BN (tRNA processing enzyme)